MGGTRRVFLSGAELGLIAGLVTTIFEAWLASDPDVQLRLGFPLALGVFDLVFWTAFGVGSALLLWATRRVLGLQRPVGRESDWTWAFLLPFAVVYSLGGRLRALVSETESFAAFAFDHLWPTFAASALVALIWANRRSDDRDGELPRLGFAFETFGIVLFVQLHARLHEVVAHLHIPVGETTLMVGALVSALAVGAFFYSVAPRLAALLTGRFGTRRATRVVMAALLALFLLSIAGTTGLAHVRNQRLLEDFVHVRDQRLVAGSDPAAAAPTAEDAAPPVILIVLDTVRADRLSVYGPTGRTPNLEAFARDAVVFDAARAASSWTLPSHASIFTGLHPREHGSHNTALATLGAEREDNALAPEFATITEILRDRGYLTAGVVSNFAYIGRLHEFQRGFDLYDDRKGTGYGFRMDLYGSLLQTFCYVSGHCPGFIKTSRQADAISGVALDVVSRTGGAPFFLFVNYYDAHMWYRPPSPYDGWFLDDPAHPKWQRMLIGFRRMVTKTLSEEEHTTYLRTQYDGEISYLDAELGRLFEALKQMGVYRRALIVVTSDHGELFDEHGFRFHGTPLYEGAVRVPLLIKFPGEGAPTGRSAAMIGSVDVMPTLLSILALPVPDGLSGRPFGGEPVAVSELYDLDPEHDVGEHHALVRWPYKYMHFAGERPAELYDLRADPNERENLIEREPRVAEALELELRSWLAAHPPRARSLSAGGAAREAKMREQLQALGYVQ